MITFDTIDNAPEMLRQSVPSNAKFVGWALLTGCSPEQYKLYRDLGRAVTGYAPLMETEVPSESIGIEGAPGDSYYLVVGG